MAGLFKFFEAAGSILDIPGKLVDRATGNDPASLEKLKGRFEAERAERTAELAKVRDKQKAIEEKSRRDDQAAARKQELELKEKDLAHQLAALRLNARLEDERAAREVELEKVRSEIRTTESKARDDAAEAAQRLELELYTDELEFKLAALKDMVEFISDVKTLHAERVMTLSVEFERLYSDALRDAQRRHEDYQEKRKAFMMELVPLRETAPELFVELIDGYRLVFRAYGDHVGILLHRIREDLPRLRDRVIEQVTQYQPEQLLERFGGSRSLTAASPKELPAEVRGEPHPRPALKPRS